MEITPKNIDKIITNLRKTIKEVNRLSRGDVWWVVTDFCLMCGIDLKVGCEHYPKHA